MQRRLVALLFLMSFFSIKGNAAEDWIPLASTDGMVWEGRAGTRVQATNKAGESIWVAEGRTINAKTKQITFRKWYVTHNDCKAGYGKLITLSMSGQFDFENDWVF